MDSVADLNSESVSEPLKLFRRLDIQDNRSVVSQLPQVYFWQRVELRRFTCALFSVFVPQGRCVAFCKRTLLSVSQAIHFQLHSVYSASRHHQKDSNIMNLEWEFESQRNNRHVSLESCGKFQWISISCIDNKSLPLCRTNEATATVPCKSGRHTELKKPSVHINLNELVTQNSRKEETIVVAFCFLSLTTFNCCNSIWVIGVFPVNVFKSSPMSL